MEENSIMAANNLLIDQKLFPICILTFFDPVFGLSTLHRLLGILCTECKKYSLCLANLNNTLRCFHSKLSYTKIQMKKFFDDIPKSCTSHVCLNQSCLMPCWTEVQLWNYTLTPWENLLKILGILQAGSLYSICFPVLGQKSLMRGKS